MKRLGARTVVLATMLMACPETKARIHRVELRKLSGTTVQLLPLQGQLPYCLVFTIAASGVIRQLTMNPEDSALECPANAPIGGVTYRLPVAEGKVKIYVLFFDRKLKASSVAAQIVDKAREATPSPDGVELTATDLRLPGQATVEVLDLLPIAEGEAMTGTIVGRNRESTDGGAHQLPDGG
jgi:hypothetical protein